MTDIRTRNGGQLLMDSLVALGAKRGFGVPGESYLAVLDAMVDHDPCTAPEPPLALDDHERGVG